MTVQLTAFLMMDGRARQAIEFYKEALEASVLFIQTYGDAPENPESPLPAHMKGLVSHAVLKVGMANIMVADMEPSTPHRSGNQIQICITTDEIEKTRKFYELLKQEGQVIMPLLQTHFSPGVAVVTDKFGVVFQIVTMTSEEAVIRGHQKDS
ncbi:VOC family protein [Paenibacillus tyrfis]|uniref:VOC family protein n=1 Tax=Paenibacillus tyrfis TaxID=1501230 RepID=UPI000B5876D9|nr:VOC family protein [Paenibacillus tyrfis]